MDEAKKQIPRKTSKAKLTGANFEGLLLKSLNPSPPQIQFPSNKHQAIRDANDALNQENIEKAEKIAKDAADKQQAAIDAAVAEAIKRMKE